MKNLFLIFSKNSFFFKCILSLLFSIGFYSILYSKTESFIFLNQFHSSYLTEFFRIITFFGDGIFVILISFLIVVFFRSYLKLGNAIILSYLFSGFVAQLFKNIITAPRPIVCLQQMKSNFYIDTFSSCNVGFSSFPSGHTATAFAIATVFGLYFNKKRIVLISLILASMVGYSRIYLGNHFVGDVLGGSLVGVLAGILAIYIANRVGSWLQTKKKSSVNHNEKPFITIYTK
jgi:undecaprenyl-diphosphatase